MWLRRVYAMARRNWKTAVVGVYAVAEAVSYYRHKGLIERLSQPTECKVDSTPEYREWLRLSLSREPDTSALLRGAFFNSCAVEDLPRSAVMQFASHLLFFVPLTDATSPKHMDEVEALVRAWEKELDTRFVEDTDSDSPRSMRLVHSFPSLGALATRGGMPTMPGFRPAMSLQRTGSQRCFVPMRQSFMQAPIAAHRSPKSPASKVSAVGDQPPELRVPGFDGINKFGDPPLSAFYKPLILQMLMGGMLRQWRRWFGDTCGFHVFHERDSMRFYVRWPKKPMHRAGSRTPMKPPILFIHGFGCGLVPYASLVTRFAQAADNASAAGDGERVIVALELPNISQGLFTGGNMPWPQQLVRSIEQVMSMVQDEQHRRAVADGNAAADTAPRRRRFVVVAHSYGTCVTGYLIHLRRHLLERVVLLDPICFQTAFHKIGQYPFNTFAAILKICEDLGLTRTATWYEVALWWFISKDVHVQAVCKRHMWGPEFWLRDGQIGNDTLVVLGGHDTVVAGTSLHEMLSAHMPDVHLRYTHEHRHTGWLTHEGLLADICNFALHGQLDDNKNDSS